MNERARQKVILALDFPTLDSAFQLAQTLSQVVGILKINIHLFTAEGPSAVAKLNSLGPGIFLDLKFHDIPNTVKGAVASAVTLPGVQLLDLHALGGLEMMRAAAKARDEAKAAGSPVPKLLAITILTSMDNAALKGVGIKGPASKRVVQLARLAQESRDGRRCCFPSRSPRHTARLREGFPDCGSWNSSRCRRRPGRRTKTQG